MVPRQCLDIGWYDLWQGIAGCLTAGDDPCETRQLTAAWDGQRPVVATLSVRSGFDAFLATINWPAGSEILVSALTIRDMVRILQQHQLVAVPIDVSSSTLGISIADLRQAITPRTRAILVAHLFGSRLPLDAVVEFAREHDLLVIEDCAQAYTGDRYEGHSGSDVACFSFGPIKTATALGGGVLTFRDSELATSVDLHQSSWKRQSNGKYLQRILKYGVLKLLNTRLVYTLFATLCKITRQDHDQLISGMVRGFPANDFVRSIRQRPSYALIRMMTHRLRHRCRTAVRHRIELSCLALQQIPLSMQVGAAAENHTWWVFPIQSESPDALMRHLWSQGFDATRGASSMSPVQAPDPSRPPPAATEHLMKRILYLPVAASANAGQIKRLTDCVRQFESGGK